MLIKFIYIVREIAQDSDIREFPVKNRDLIILSSDGMFDVVQDNVIEKVVNHHNDKVNSRLKYAYMNIKKCFFYFIVISNKDLQGIADELLSQTMKCRNPFFILEFLRCLILIYKCLKFKLSLCPYSKR